MRGARCELSDIKFILPLDMFSIFKNIFDVFVSILAGDSFMVSQLKGDF